jgi:hypothetical protein
MRSVLLIAVAILAAISTATSDNPNDPGMRAKS